MFWMTQKNKKSGRTGDLKNGNLLNIKITQNSKNTKECLVSLMVSLLLCHNDWLEQCSLILPCYWYSVNQYIYGVMIKKKLIKLVIIIKEFNNHRAAASCGKVNSVITGRLPLLWGYVRLSIANTCVNKKTKWRQTRVYIIYTSFDSSILCPLLIVFHSAAFFILSLPNWRFFFWHYMELIHLIHH